MRQSTQRQTNPKAFAHLEPSEAWRSDAEPSAWWRPRKSARSHARMSRCPLLVLNESLTMPVNRCHDFLDKDHQRMCHFHKQWVQRRIRCYCRLTVTFDHRYGRICGNWTCENSTVARILFPYRSLTADHHPTTSECSSYHKRSEFDNHSNSTVFFQ